VDRAAWARARAWPWPWGGRVCALRPAHTNSLSLSVYIECIYLAAASRCCCGSLSTQRSAVDCRPSPQRNGRGLTRDVVPRSALGVRAVGSLHTSPTMPVCSVHPPSVRPPTVRPPSIHRPSIAVYRGQSLPGALPVGKQRIEARLCSQSSSSAAMQVRSLFFFFFFFLFFLFFFSFSLGGTYLSTYIHTYVCIITTGGGTCSAGYSAPPPPSPSVEP